jgi:hypothetical protein
MLVALLALSSAIEVPDHSLVFFRNGEVSYSNPARKVFGAYFPTRGSLNVNVSDISTVTLPLECQSVIVSSRLSEDIIVTPSRGVTNVCVWYVSNYAYVSVTPRSTAPITAAISDGRAVNPTNVSGRISFDVRDNLLLRFTFSGPDSTTISVIPRDSRAPLPSLKTSFVVGSSVHHFVNERSGTPTPAREPTFPGNRMGTGETWELLETMFALGVGIVLFAIFWCCLAACCYRRAQRRNARRQEIALDGNELEAIPPVLPVQPVAYGYVQPPIAYPGPQPQCQPQQAQAQYAQYQQPLPQGGREPGIVYGH